MVIIQIGDEPQTLDLATVLETPVEFPSLQPSEPDALAPRPVLASAPPQPTGPLETPASTSTPPQTVSVAEPTHVPLLVHAAGESEPPLEVLVREQAVTKTAVVLPEAPAPEETPLDSLGPPYRRIRAPELSGRRYVQFASAEPSQSFGYVWDEDDQAPGEQVATAPAFDGSSERPGLADATSSKSRGPATETVVDPRYSGETRHRSRLSDEPAPFLTEGDIPDRPPLLLELGDPFLDTGELDEGFELPTGAVWQPRLWVFGTYRTSVQTIDTGDPDRTSEWVNRFDLFANLQLTGTEKLVAGIRPFDKNRPDNFSGYRFEPTEEDGFQDDLNVDLRTLFFEGDLGSLFPAADPEGQTLLDFGFSIGRQPLIYQDGILISDTVDAVGLVRNNIRLPGVSNLRVAGVYGWNGFDELTRSAGGVPAVDDENLQMVGLFTEWDTPVTTVNVDSAYVWDTDRSEGGDGVYGGISAAQRLGHLNTTFRVNGSLATNEESLLVRDGVLLSSELSWTPHATNDTLYFNPFVAFGEYLQAAREQVDGGGPLAPLGILFASPNIGEFGSEISNRANDVGGFALGYQAFWDDNRRNLVVEFAAREDLGLDDGANANLDGFGQYALGFQFQQAIGQRMLFQVEGFGALQEDRDEAYGGRVEILYQF